MQATNTRVGQQGHYSGVENVLDYKEGTSMFSLTVALLLSPGYKAQTFQHGTLWIVVQMWLDRDKYNPWSYELFRVNNKTQWLSYGTRYEEKELIQNLKQNQLDEKALIWEPIGWQPPQQILVSQLPEKEK